LILVSHLKHATEESAGISIRPGAESGTTGRSWPITIAGRSRPITIAGRSRAIAIAGRSWAIPLRSFPVAAWPQSAQQFTSGQEPIAVGIGLHHRIAKTLGDLIGRQAAFSTTVSERASTSRATSIRRPETPRSAEAFPRTATSREVGTQFFARQLTVLVLIHLLQRCRGVLDFRLGNDAVVISVERIEDGDHSHHHFRGRATSSAFESTARSTKAGAFESTPLSAALLAITTVAPFRAFFAIAVPAANFPFAITAISFGTAFPITLLCHPCRATNHRPDKQRGPECVK
jgi:hypothetical protein